MPTVSETLDARSAGYAATLPAEPSDERESSASDADDGDTMQLLAKRITWFGFVTAGLSASFLAYRTIYEAVTGHVGKNFGVELAHAGSVVCCLGMALAARTRRTAPQLRTIEAIGLVGASTSLIVMSGFISVAAQPRHTALLALALVMFIRSAFIPSTGRCTVVLGGVITLPLLATIFLNGLTFDSTVTKPVYPAAAATTPLRYAIGVTVDGAAWWAMIVAASTAATRVIYGLRSEVRSARKLGRYHLEERLGAGGMGVVYRARHALLDRPMAVKVLPPERLTEDGRRRFAREVQLTAQLRHPSTISVFDYGRTADGLFYYAMEYVEGATLAEMVEASGPQPPPRVVSILRAIAGALVEAHGLGLVHRDLKPANVMVQLPHDYGGVHEITKVLDFGLVKDTREASDVARTKPGTLRGTPQYLAPESIKNPDAVGPASDLYALGAVGYFLLCGVPVFEGESVVEVCAQHLRDEPVPPSRRLGRPVDGELERIILACLRKRPEERPDSALVLDQMLSQLRCEPWSAADSAGWWRQYGEAISRARAADRARVSEDLDPLRGSSRPRPR